jgi:hypothetical protein
MTELTDSQPAPARMDTDAARQIARHTKAALMHLVTAQQLAEQAGLDVLADGGAAALFRAALDAVEDLDLWTINTAYASGAGRETFAHTERWCQAPDGRLPTGEEK